MFENGKKTKPCWLQDASAPSVHQQGNDGSLVVKRQFDRHSHTAHSHTAVCMWDRSFPVDARSVQNIGHPINPAAKASSSGLSNCKKNSCNILFKVTIKNAFR